MTPPIRQAVVLAGGSGSRLGSLTASTPKPLLNVGGRPFLDWILDRLDRAGVEEVILTIGYRAEAFDRWLEERDSPPVVTTFVEDTPLDTGGALSLLADRLDPAFFVLNGDTIFDAPLPPLGEALDREGIEAAVALRRVADTSRFGRVALDGEVITSFAEKGSAGEGLINGGVYAFRRDVVLNRSVPLSIERELLPELVENRRALGLPHDGFFIDIGVPESFEEAQRSVPRWWGES